MTHPPTHRPWFAPVVVALATAIAFGALVASPWFADPDAFYHVRMAQLIRDTGVVRAFPWLPYTELARHFADQHFLYHLLLIPFVSFPEPLLGMKIATIALGVLFFVMLHAVLKDLGVRWALPGTLLLLLVAPLTFRIALGKGNALALTIFLVAVWCLFRYRPRTLLLVSALYVWAYGGFPLVLVAAAVYVVASLIVDALERRRHPLGILRRLFRGSRDGPRAATPHAWRLLGAAGLGVLAGLIINPFFPNNLPFLYNQFLRIGVINYRSVIGVGGEWYPYGLPELLTQTILLTIPLLGALLAFAATGPRQSRRSWTLLVLTALMFLATLKSRRYIEYYVPVGLVFALSALTDAYRPRELARRVREAARQIASRWRSFLGAVALATYVLILLPTVATRDLVREWHDLRSGFRATQYAAALGWLKTNAPQGSVVVHSDWDEFPILFYRNDQARYIAGLDATFLYTADPDRYWTWVHISTGEYDGDLLAGLRQLDAAYVFVDAEHAAMDRLVRRDGRLTVAYAASDATIYRVPRSDE